MKKIVYLVLFLIILSCSSQKILTESDSFEIGKAMCQKWVGGRESSGSGLDLMIVVNFPEKTNITVKEMFFRGKQAPATIFSTDNNKFIKAEFLNSVANSKETSRLKLKTTEAVLSYLENDTLKFTKIMGIKEKQPLLYNSRPKN